ncbi:hypothetical protein BU23DRAFT_574141 [Bimuria novae-zelandiae CBS 107.79]|uniref:Rhodopsin domain-containing protein n=1 Tax=Bimuria novae-zelandiae CBS 107.79 TaxID=1447943 RepID=A0A6A5UNS5_9PLEO|nr:hypothetical protein BU23DRAFT_574141 [Bimuria novae-zelandiae CBS 107.79]
MVVDREAIISLLRDFAAGIAISIVYSKAQWGIKITWYICTVAAVPFVAMRMYSRWSRLGSLAIEDYLIVLSLCCLIGDLGIQQHRWNLGLGHMSTVTPDKLKGILRMIVPGSILYVSSLWAVKFALVFFYKRLAVPGSRLILLYNIALGLLAATYLTIFVDIVFQCFPHSRRWSSNPKDKCDPKGSIINYWITILFVRAYYSKRNQTMLTYTVSMIETTIAIIAACLPALRSMIIGGSNNDASSYGRHYELDSARRKTSDNRLGASNATATIGTGTTSGTHTKKATHSNGSEDSLMAAGLSVGLDGRGKIMVDTTIEAMYEDEDKKSKKERSRSEV